MKATNSEDGELRISIQSKPERLDFEDLLIIHIYSREYEGELKEFTKSKSVFVKYLRDIVFSIGSENFQTATRENEFVENVLENKCQKYLEAIKDIKKWFDFQ